MEPNNTSTPTYAENLLFAAGFTFSHKEETLLRGEPLNLHLPRIAKVDIESIVKNVDIELLSSFLEDIAFCDVTEEDLKLHSDRTYVKLFQLCQLIIEYQLDVTDTLSANLNGLAKVGLVWIVWCVLNSLYFPLENQTNPLPPLICMFTEI